MKPVTDPSLLAQLEQKGPVTDPALLAQLEGDGAPKATKTPREIAQSLFASPSGLDTAKNIGMGGLEGAAEIGSTIMWPLDATGITGMNNKERRALIKDFSEENADPESLAFKGGKLGTQIAGTAGVGGVLAKGAQAIPAIAKFAPALQSGGFSLGNAATGSKLANALIRGTSGAITGGAQVGMIDPEKADTGMMIAAAIPVAGAAAAGAGHAIGSGFNAGAKKLMQSALKPTIEQLRTGKAGRAVETLLDEGINPTRGGVEKLRGIIGNINDDVASRIQGSTASVDKQKVMDALNQTRDQFSKQVAPTSDIAAISGVADDFAAHPMIKGDSIPVQLAQMLKQGTYKTLSKKYGQIGSAETEAQKALARGLKEGISKAVPEVAALNARESALINAMTVAERRALMDANKNPMGLALLANHPATWAAFMADKSALFKSLAGRLLNQTGKMGSGVQAPPALSNFAQQHGVLNAPSVFATSD